MLMRVKMRPKQLFAYFIGEDEEFFPVSKLDDFNNILTSQDLTWLSICY